MSAVALSPRAHVAWTAHRLAEALLAVYGRAERPEDLPEVRQAFAQLDAEELDEVTTALEECDDEDSGEWPPQVEAQGGR